MKYIIYGKMSGALLLVLLLAGCGGTEEEQTEEGQTESEADEAPDEEAASEELESGEVNSEEPEPLIDEEDIAEDGSIQTLVNKEHHLSADYVPEDLVPVEVPTVLESPEINQLRQEASGALTEMFDAALEDGITLYARSGYRSYNTQASLYDGYREAHGEEAANRFSAPPGASEHQTGLAMDVTAESVNLELLEAFGETDEGIWVRENAHEYGFIIRYPEGKEEITGYLYEPWHLRYLGTELASDIHDSGLTYEEYIRESGINIEEDGE